MRETPQAFRLVGGRLCLDFLNTADWSPQGEVILEKLETEGDLAAWCRRVGLGPLAAADPQAAVEDLRVFRSALRRLFLAVITGARPKQEDLAHLNRCLEGYPTGGLLSLDDSSIRFTQSATVKQAVAVSATALLTAEWDVRRVRKCPADDCGWLFLDESRNRRRRWCAMETCGNRAKARRHYRRHSGQ